MAESVTGGSTSRQHRPWETSKSFASASGEASPTSLVEILDTAYSSEVDQPSNDCIG